MSNLRIFRILRKFLVICMRQLDLMWLFVANKQWPYYFFKSDSMGEKNFEEFFNDNEDLDIERFETVGMIKNQPDFDEAKLDDFMDGIEALRNKGTWTKDEIVKLYFGLMPEFAHKETGKYLDQRI